MKMKIALLGMVLGISLLPGAALQRSTSSSSSPLPDPSYGDLSLGQRHDGLDDSAFHGQAEAREKAANANRQKVMTREAADLLRVAGELQLKAQKSESEVSREELVRELDTIEKLAHNVKERMKGGR